MQGAQSMLTPDHIGIPQLLQVDILQQTGDDVSLLFSTFFCERFGIYK